MKAAPSREAIKYDLPCPRCGYNLRGLNSDHLCPECGQGAHLALRSKSLRDADPKWVGTLSGGLNYEIACVLILPWALVAEFYFLATATVPASLILLTGIGRLLFASACFLITSPEPAVAGNPTVRTRVRLIRVLAVISFVSGIGCDISQSSQTPTMPARVFSYASFATIAAFLGKLWVLWSLARRFHAWNPEQIFTVFGFLHKLWTFAILGVFAGLLLILLALDKLIIIALLLVAGFAIVYLIALVELKWAVSDQLDLA